MFYLQSKRGLRTDYFLASTDLIQNTEWLCSLHISLRIEKDWRAALLLSPLGLQESLVKVFSLPSCLSPQCLLSRLLKTVVMLLCRCSIMLWLVEKCSLVLMMIFQESAMRMRLLTSLGGRVPTANILLPVYRAYKHGQKSRSTFILYIALHPTEAFSQHYDGLYYIEVTTHCFPVV